MVNTYWLGRASFELAQRSESAETRIIHYDVPGRYGLKPLSAEIRASGSAAAPPPAIHAVNADDDDGKDGSDA